MSDTEKSASTEGTPDPAARKKKGGKGRLLLIIGASVVVLGTGGFAAYWKFGRSAPPAEGAEAEHKDEKKHEGHGILNFEPFIVNLADTDARRFLRIKVSVIVPEEEDAKEIEHHTVSMARLRADILEQLTTQTAAQVSSPEGKAALKKAISEHAAKILEPIEVSDVLFSDFVVQY